MDFDTILAVAALVSSGLSWWPSFRDAKIIKRHADIIADYQRRDASRVDLLITQYTALTQRLLSLIERQGGRP